MKYKLTRRGIWSIRFILAVLASGTFYFGALLIQYFNFEEIPNVKEIHSPLSLSKETDPAESESSNTIMDENSLPPSTNETYTTDQLEDLKTFKMDFENENEEENFTSVQLKELEYLQEVLSHYSKESLTIEAYDLKDPFVKKIVQLLVAVNFDENQIVLKSLEDTIALGAEKKLISIYFTNHYQLAKNAK